MNKNKIIIFLVCFIATFTLNFFATAVADIQNTRKNMEYNFSNKKTNIKYISIMSNDITICDPLLYIYNKLLKRYLFSSIHNYGPYDGGATDFEVWDPQQFQEIGLMPLSDFKSPEQPSVFSVNLFGEHSPRTIYQYDQWSGKSIITHLLILKAHAEYREEVKDNVVGPSSEIIERDAGFNGLLQSQKNLEVPAVMGYLLTKWPHFSEIYQEWYKKIRQKNFTNLPIVPAISGVHVSARVFSKSGKPYFIINNYTEIPHADEGKIIVYEITQQSQNEVCYFVLKKE